MKNLISLIAASVALLLPVVAQEEQGYGFLNLANLIPGDVPCGISIGGKKVVPDGLGGGTYTGWFMVKTGSTDIEVSYGELGEESGSIQVAEGQGNIIAIYLEPDTRTNSEGRPYPPRLRIRSFPIYESRGYGLKFVSLYPELCRFQLGSLKIEAKPFDAIEVPNWNGRGFQITANGEPAGIVTGSSEGGAFYLLAGTDQNGGKAAVLISANQQEVPEYLRKKKPTAEESAATSETPVPPDPEP
ncbi:MAG: hypothetical protein ACSHX9_09715 [Luteolibacter sp.]